MNMDLLQIYDADDTLMRMTGKLRDADEVVGINGGVKGLMKFLDQLVSEQKVFRRAVFHTHGNEGFIAFGHERGNSGVNSHLMRTKFAGRRYETLFAYNARIYFNGCNVAQGEKGWRFLEDAGSIFLGGLGGVTFGHTKKGYPLAPILLPAVFLGPLTLDLFWRKKGGHSYHGTEARYVYTAPGGMIFSRSG